MTFFGIIGNNPLAMLFIVISLLNVYYALRIGANVRSHWAEFQREPLQAWQKRLLDQAAFFLGIPLGVVVHELAHAVTIEFFGGRVVDAGYGFYWGYVVPDRVFSPPQEWLIAIAGTIGSLVYGVVVWLLFRRIRRSASQYFALRVLRVHLVYSLVYYPIFTLVTFVGDWRTIYDFKATPLLSGFTLVAHAATLGLFYWADRRGMFEMPAFADQADREQFEALQARAAANPQDVESRVKLADAYRRSGMTNLAKQELNGLLGRNPNSAEAYVQLAAIQAEGKRQVPKRARDNAEKALALGLTSPQGLAFANLLVGQYSIGVGQVDKAIDHYSQGIEAARRGGNANTTGRLYYLRATAYRRKGQYAAAEADIQEAIARAQHANQGQLLRHYEGELEAIRHESNT
jgi:tetratricopeptide (TPR) repeat protein